MLEKFFNLITRGSIKFKWVTILLSVLIISSGIFAFTQLNQELIPKIEFPQTIVLGLNPGMDADTLLQQVTIPLEKAVSDLDGVVNVETNTSDGLSLAIIRNEFGADQEEIQRLIQNALDQLSYPDGMEKPELLTFSLSDLPIASLSISADDMTLQELRTLVEDEIVPELEGISSVAAVNISGGQELPSGDVIVEPDTESDVIDDVTDDVIVEGITDLLLPESWISVFASQGFTITKPQELTPEILSGIISAAPQMLQELSPEMQHFW